MARLILRWPNSAALSVALVSRPSHGTLTIGEDGAFSYTPATGYSGEDSFVFAVSYGHASREAIASLSVIANVPSN